MKYAKLQPQRGVATTQSDVGRHLVVQPYVRMYIRMATLWQFFFSKNLKVMLFGICSVAGSNSLIAPEGSDASSYLASPQTVAEIFLCPGCRCDQACNRSPDGMVSVPTLRCLQPFGNDVLEVDSCYYDVVIVSFASIFLYVRTHVHRPVRTYVCIHACLNASVCVRKYGRRYVCKKVT